MKGIQPWQGVSPAQRIGKMQGIRPVKRIGPARRIGEMQRIDGAPLRLLRPDGEARPTKKQYKYKQLSDQQPWVSLNNVLENALLEK
jgi:hypothetical protein